MLVVAALCAQTTTFLVKRLHPDLMPLPLCTLGPLLELLLLRDLLRLVACGHIGFTVGGHLSGFEVCPLQSFLMTVEEFLAQVPLDLPFLTELGFFPEELLATLQIPETFFWLSRSVRLFE